MTFLEEFRLVLEALRAHRVRTLLTLLGIILGVGTLVALSSAVESAGRYMELTMQQASGEDVISVSKRWWGEDAAHKKAPPLNRFDSRALATAGSLEGAMVLNRYSMRVQWGERWGQNVWVIGTLPAAIGFYRLDMDRGRFLSQGDVWGRTPVAVLGSQAAKALFRGVPDPVGKEVKLKGQRFRIIGVMKDKPSLGKGEFWTWDKTAVIPETAYVDRFESKRKELGEIVVRAPGELIAESGLLRVVEAAKAIVTWRHHGIQNFRITDPRDTARTAMIVTLIVGGLELAIAGVCLGVGGINLMNIMLVSVLQRTREIGIRRALGATRGNIRRTFLTEAAIMAAVGGVLGVAGGVGFAWLLALVLGKVFGFWPFVFPWLESALGVAAALLVGVGFGFYPAHRAASLAPIECLRYE